jgi:pyruvate dehydrogenase (quinone)
VSSHQAADRSCPRTLTLSTLWNPVDAIGSYNLGSMANAMPQALGAQLWAPDRQTVAFCGDGGLSMLLGDLMTIKTYQLPVVKLVVFDNRRPGMVKLEQETGRPA